jgi:putative oxidoreductase
VFATAAGGPVCERNAVRRLFSTFARGWPGAGLLLLRVVAAIALFCQAIFTLGLGQSAQSIVFPVVAIGAGVLLLLGLWTPIAGILTALVELRNVSSRCDSLWVCILLATLGVALAMIGPGAWSLDARLFGWKRIHPR